MWTETCPVTVMETCPVRVTETCPVMLTEPGWVSAVAETCPVVAAEGGAARATEPCLVTMPEEGPMTAGVVLAEHSLVIDLSARIRGDALARGVVVVLQRSD